MGNQQDSTKTRYVGIYLTSYSYECAILGKQRMLRKSHGMTSAKGKQALYRKLQAEDKVVMIAGSQAFIMAKEIEATVGCRVYVLNLECLPSDYPSPIDAVDATALAQLAENLREDGLSPALPDEAALFRHKLERSFRRSRHDWNMTLRQLHSLFISNGVTKIGKKALRTASQRREALELLNDFEQQEAQHLLVFLELYEQRIADLERQLLVEREKDLFDA